MSQSDAARPETSSSPSSTSAQPAAGSDTSITEYTMYAVFRRDVGNELELEGRGIVNAVDELEGVVIELAEAGAKVRGFYDVSGFRHDGELLVWLHGEAPETLQWALRQIRRTQLFRALVPSWQAVGVHRAAEFNPRHMPAYMTGAEPRDWVTVYPFVRSYEWYLLPEEDRRRMLADHGRRGAAFTTTLANTVASFGISDYEWLLALEDDDPMNLVDMMRDLRYTEARLHVREETPFYTGRRIQPADVVEVLQ